MRESERESGSESGSHRDPAGTRPDDVEEDPVPGERGAGGTARPEEPRKKHGDALREGTGTRHGVPGAARPDE
jgi:hypothetical protein